MSAAGSNGISMTGCSRTSCPCRCSSPALGVLRTRRRRLGCSTMHSPSPRTSSTKGAAATSGAVGGGSAVRPKLAGRLPPPSRPDPAGGPVNVLDQSIADLDPDIAQVLDKELARQQRTLEMIASENFVPRAVLQAQG